jgi:hypothetical protein
MIRLLGMPGSVARIRLDAGRRIVKSVELDGVADEKLTRGGTLELTFPGRPLKKPWHRKIGDLEPCPVPADAEALYESTCFAADNNALEVRSLQRSGPSSIAQVNAAREAFFTKRMFISRGIWDKKLFDGDIETFFAARLEGRALRIDFGRPVQMDRFVLRMRDREEPDLNPALYSFADDAAAEVSPDLKSWTPLAPFWKGKGTIAVAKVPASNPIRYVRIHGAPRRIAEFEGYNGGEKLDSSRWRASNLFASYARKPARAAWSLRFVPEEIPDHAYLVVAVNGRHGNEGAWAALGVEGELVGAPDRAVSFPSNTWEYQNVEADSNYSYYFPLRREQLGKKVEIVVLILEGGSNEVKPEAWTTAYPIPYQSRTLTLHASE